MLTGASDTHKGRGRVALSRLPRTTAMLPAGGNLGDAALRRSAGNYWKGDPPARL